MATQGMARFRVSARAFKIGTDVTWVELDASLRSKWVWNWEQNQWMCVPTQAGVTPLCDAFLRDCWNTAKNANAIFLAQKERFLE